MTVLCRPAFTLVELMVVVAIIVVLLAMLAPALDRAIYAAEMAVCGSNLKSTGTSVVSYAMNFKRRYPYRAAVFDEEARALQVDSLNYPFSSSGNRNPDGHEDRAPLVGYVEFKALVCPLAGGIDLAPSEASKNTWVFANYAIWWGWQYHTPGAGVSEGPDPTSSYSHPPGMLKMGDRLHYVTQGGQPITYKFNLLAADHTYNAASVNAMESTHPDSLGALALDVAQDAFVPAFAAVHGNPDIRITRSTWSGPFNFGGLLDLNYLYDDGSVGRFDRVDHRLGAFDRRLVRVPNSPEGYDAQFLYQMLPDSR
jgi:prepilin-type N-terminal cleavage/methylation domain-containing protein